MVKYVITEHADKPIANKVLDWLDAQGLSIGITEEYREFEIIRSVKSALKIGCREERAAADILAEELQKGIDEVMLLFDESHFEKRLNYLRPLPANVRPYQYPCCLRQKQQDLKRIRNFLRNACQRSTPLFLKLPKKGQ